MEIESLEIPLGDLTPEIALAIAVTQRKEGPIEHYNYKTASKKWRIIYSLVRQHHATKGFPQP